MDYQDAPQAGVPIHYERIVQQDGFVTGIAVVDSPAGAGRFQMRVSGQRASIDEYESQAVILQLDVVRIDNAEQVDAGMRQQTLAARRLELLQRLERAKAFVEAADLAQLNDLAVLCQHLQPEGKQEDCPQPEEDLSQDRLIEIVPLDDLDLNLAYRLTFKIHPTVPRGRRDIYKPVVQGSTSASASITVSAGDADLSLYRGGIFFDGSYSAGASDAVYGSGGVGQWKLHVIGFSNATYQLFGDWVLRRNNV